MTKIQDAEMMKRPSDEAKPQPVESRPTAPPNTFRAVLRRAKSFQRPGSMLDVLSYSERETPHTLPKWIQETNTFRQGVADGSILVEEV